MNSNYPWRNAQGKNMAMLLLALLLFPVLLSAGQGPADPQQADRIRVIVNLADPPLAQYQGTIRNLPATAISKTGAARLDPAGPESQAYLNYLESAQNNFKSALAQAVPEAEVQYAHRIVFNGLTVSIPPDRIPLLNTIPGVVSISREREFKMDMDAGLPLIGLGSGKIGGTWTDSGLWKALGGHAYAGKDIRVADIDSGISLSNACFDSTGYAYPSGFPKYGTGFQSFVNPKVIAARAYFRADDPPVGPATPADDTIERGGGHGTHTAGTIACNYGVTTPFGGTIISGVAPKAHIMVYRVFYRSKSGSNSAWTPELVAAIEDAVADGAQVVNNSWGGLGLSTSSEDPEIKAYYGAIDAGLVVIFSAGNNGSGTATMGHPGYAKRFITAGASTTNRIFTTIVRADSPNPPVDLSNVSAASIYPGSGLTAPTIDLEAEGYSDNIACSGPIPATLPNGTTVGGKIVVIRRYSCALVTKADNAKAGGAVGVIVRNTPGYTNMPLVSASIPYAHINQTDGDRLYTWLKTVNGAKNTTARMTITGPAVPAYTDAPDVIASFSSRGPTPDYLIKPDLTAPGVNTLSSVSGSGFDFYQGTSMAAPHITGAAALLKQAHLDWTHDQIKSAMMTSAAEPTSLGLNPQDRGSGRLNMDHPQDPGLTVDTPSVSFGLLFPNSKSPAVIRNITLKNVSSAESTYTITVAETSGNPTIRPQVNPTSVTLQPGGTASLEVKLSLTTNVGYTINFFGKILLTDGTANHVLHIPYWGRLHQELADADVLIIDDDNSADFQVCPDRLTNYTTMLNRLELTYVIYEVKKANNYTIDFDLARRYPKVLYFTGNAGCGGDLSFIGYPFWNFLANGGKMVITGQDIGSLDDWAYKTYNWSFYPDVFFGAKYVTGTLSIKGVTATRAYGDADYSSFLAGRQYDFAPGGDGANNQTSPDEILAGVNWSDVDAYPILTSQDSTLAKPRHLGSRLSSEPTIERAQKKQPITLLGCRTIYLSFGLEGVNNTAGGSTGTREELLDRLFAWLDDAVSAQFSSTGYSGSPNSQVAFQATASVSITKTSKGYTNSITKYRWDFGDASAIVTTTTPSTTHTYAAAGSYTAYVEATDTFGHKAVNKVTVTIGGSLTPGAATLISPSGTITTTTPTYTWNVVSAATWYNLYVRDSSGAYKIQSWYTTAQAGCSSGTGVCAVTPTTVLASGNGQWWIQTNNDAGNGPWSTGLSFTVSAGGPPGAATLISPSGTITTSTPTYRWNGVSSSTWYYLWVQDSTGISTKTWYTAAQAGCSLGAGTCSVTATNSLAAGNWQWWVQTYNDYGSGPWSTGLSFAVSTGGPPEAATLISPSGTITTSTPNYKWNAVSSSTWYYLWLQDSAGFSTKTWYTAAQAGCSSGSGTCSVTATTSLAAGNWQWWVQTYNDYGTGPWSTGLSFTVSAGGPPGAATLISPSGTITTSTPTYKWNAVSNSTWYYLWVQDSTGLSTKTWFSAAQAGCSSGAGTCSVAATTSLAAGNWQWWVQTYNDYGYGPWSSSLSFNVTSGGLPEAATLVTPSGTTYLSMPTYIWKAVSNSTWYYLWVQDSTGEKIKSWYAAAQANCSSGIGLCSITPTTALVAGNYQWWIQTYNDFGNGPWSDGMSFTVAPLGVSPIYPLTPQRKPGE